MNSTFKVVFNKARGALMVVNEVTSSVQAKGTKTVVAAAVATMIAGVAGTAMAAEWEVAPEGLEAATDTVITDANWAAIKDQNAFELTSSDKEAKKSWASVAKDQTFDKTLWVSGAGAKAHASGFGVSGEKVKFTNKGTIYVTSGKDGVNYQNDAIWAGNGATAINEGKIVAKDAYGMRVGTGDTASKIVNNGSIYVESTGAGMELGGAANSEAVNNGLISVGDVNTESKQALDFGHGVLIQDQTGAKFTNNGTITAGEGASAIEIKKDKATTSAEINLGEKSQIDGLINIGTGTQVTLNAKGMTGKLQVKAADGTTTLNVTDGSNVELVDDQKSVYETVNVEKGTLNASIWGADNTFKSVTVEKNGVFNITKLNSGGDKDKLETKPHDTLLLSRNQSFTFNDSALHVGGKVFTGKLKVGQLANADQTHKGTVAFNGGDHAFEYLTIGSDSQVTIADGTLDLGTLHLYQKGEHGKDGGQIVVHNATLSADKLTFETGAKGITLNNGTFTTGHANLFKDKALTPAAGLITGNGVVDVADWTGEYTLDDVKNAQNKFNDQDTTIQVTFTNAKLNAKAEDLTAGNVQGLRLADATGVAANGAFDVSAATNDTVLAAIDFGGKEAVEKSVTITSGNQAVVLSGNDGDVFKNLKATTETVDANGNLVLGDKATSKGTVNVKNLQAETLKVVGDFAAQNVVVTTAGAVDGVLTLDTLNVADTAVVNVAGALVVNGAFDKDGKALADIKGAVTVDGEGAVLTTNRAGFKAVAAKLEKTDLAKSIIYVDRTLNLEGATLTAGTAPADASAAPEAQAPDVALSSVVLHGDGLAVVNAASFLGQKNAAFGDATVDATAGELLIVNVSKLGDVKLGKSVADKSHVDTDSLYVLVDKDSKFADGVASLVYAKGLHNDKTVDARLEGLFKQGASAKEMAVLNALENEAYVAVDEKTGKEYFNALGEAALEQATGGNATAGVLNVAYDANAQVTDAIVRHQLSEHAGMGVWADVFYAKNEAKKLYGDFGYSADIYGGVLGFDYTAACGGTLGAALTVGTADADSEGGALSNSLSSDFVGLSVYASKDFSGLNVKADLGYIDFSNDFTGLGDASDATTITFGVRGDFTAYQNGAFSVVPHMGLRYTRIDTDAVAFNDEQNMNVLEAPIGVKFAGTFEATGWKLVPSYDFTIVPQLGDKEVEAFGTAGDITILSGGLFNNVLGVEAVKDNMSFGLNASYGFGPDDRANTQINANFRYNF